MAKSDKNKNRRTLIIYVIVSIIVLLGGVLPFALPRADTISGTGTIQFVNLEGGFYGIKSDDGIQYDPTDLDPNFAQNGTRVEFTGRIRTDIVNVHQWGTMLDVTSIEQLP